MEKKLRQDLQKHNNDNPPYWLVKDKESFASRVDAYNALEKAEKEKYELKEQINQLKAQQPFPERDESKYHFTPREYKHPWGYKSPWEHKSKEFPMYLLKLLHPSNFTPERIANLEQTFDMTIPDRLKRAYYNFNNPTENVH